MDISLIAARYDPWVVSLSYLIATFASYVALDLAERVRTPDGLMALTWWVGGSLAMGTGIWSMHFVGMLAVTLPIEVGICLCRHSDVLGYRGAGFRCGPIHRQP